MDTLSHPDLPFEIEQDPITGRCVRRDIQTGAVQPASDIETLLVRILCKLTDLEEKVSSPKAQKKELFDKPEQECTDDFCPTPEPSSKTTKKKS